MSISQRLAIRSCKAGAIGTCGGVTHNAHGAFMARGVHGQALYIDPAAEMVIARFASHPVAGNAIIDPTSLPAYEAVARHLMGEREALESPGYAQQFAAGATALTGRGLSSNVSYQ